MTHEERLAEEIAVHGSLEMLPWGTLNGNRMRLGDMTDEHVENCILYHKGARMMWEAEVDEGHTALLAAKYIEYKMRRLKESRKQKEQE